MISNAMLTAVELASLIIHTAIFEMLWEGDWFARSRRRQLQNASRNQNRGLNSYY